MLTESSRPSSSGRTAAFMKEMKKIKDALFLISACAALCACGKGEEKSSVTTASSSGGIAATLQEAIENTKDNYKMDIESGIGYSFPYQIISDSLYYYAPANENFIRLDEDKDYYHSFERAELDTDEIYRFGMNVHSADGVDDFEVFHLGFPVIQLLELCLKVLDFLFGLRQSRRNAQRACRITPAH